MHLEVVFKKYDAVISRHEFMVLVGDDFSLNIRDAIATFRKNFPTLSLFDNGISFTVRKVGEQE